MTQEANTEDFDLTADDVDSLIEGVELDIPGDNGTVTLRDLMTDVVQGHYELDAYRRGALTYCDVLDDRILAAKNQGDEDLAELLSEVRDATFNLVERIVKIDGSGPEDAAADYAVDKDGKAEPLDLADDAEDRIIVNESINGGSDYKITD